MGLFDETEETVKGLTVPVEYSTPDLISGKKKAPKSKEVLAKHAAYAVLRQAGAGPSQAASILGYTAQTGSKLEKRLNAYEIQRDKLTSLAVKATRNIIQGKPVGATATTDPTTGKQVLTGGVMPKGSDVMRAVELVLDREQPKVALSASVTAEFMPIDLTQYQ